MANLVLDFIQQKQSHHTFPVDTHQTSILFRGDVSNIKYPILCCITYNKIEFVP